MRIFGDGVTRRDIVGGFLSAVLINAIGASPALFFGADTDWFERPWFFPPEILFPIAWTILFTLMGIAVYIVWRYGTDREAVTHAVGVFVVQLILNVLWTPAFFGLQRPDLGLLVIVALWLAIVATIWAFHRVKPVAAWLLLPYLAWVSFATILNYAIYVHG